jgi:beta-fructofuranosidase
VDSPSGSFAAAAARLLSDDSLYCGRIVADRSGQPVLLAFRYHDLARRFVGELSDPMPVAFQDGRLKILGGPKS